MLEAVRDILDIPNDASSASAAAKVDCARIMLDKIIEGMQVKEMTLIPSALSPEIVQPEPVKPVKIIPKDKRKIVVGSNSIIKDILNFPDDGKIELDGKIMTKKEAIGKKFDTGRFVE